MSVTLVVAVAILAAVGLVISWRARHVPAGLAPATDRAVLAPASRTEDAVAGPADDLAEQLAPTRAGHDNVFTLPVSAPPPTPARPEFPAPRHLVVGAAAGGGRGDSERGGKAAQNPPVKFDAGTAGMVVAPGIRLRHRVDELVVAAGLPACATTFVVVVGDRQDRPDRPLRHGLVAFASGDDTALKFRNWFTIDGGAIPTISISGQSPLATVVDQIAKAIATDASQAGPVVQDGQILPRATNHLTGLANLVATDLASGGVFDVDHGLLDAVACVGIVVPVVDGDGRGAVQMVLVAVAEHLSQGARVVRDLAISAVHEVLIDLRRELLSTPVQRSSPATH